MEIKGIVTAAGMSSRMGDFKPLLKLNGFPMIQMTVQSMKNAGVEGITVVTGMRAREVESALESMEVCKVRNTDYASTDMLTSIRLGLKKITDADAIFLLPGDMPLVSPQTFCKLRHIAEKTVSAVVYPVFNGRRAHPPLIKGECFEAILSYEGENGLRGALREFPSIDVSVDDPCVVMDADYRDDYMTLKCLARKYKGISRELCENLYDEAKLPFKIREHCRDVGTLARYLSEHLVKFGYCIDIELCESGGRLHDITLVASDHPDDGADFLRKKGFQTLAEIVYGYKLLKKPVSDLDEASLILLADELVKDNYAISSGAYSPNTNNEYPLIMDDEQRLRPNNPIYEKLLRKFETITGEALVKRFKV